MDVRDGDTAPRTPYEGRFTNRRRGRKSKPADVDPDRLPGARVEHLGRVAVADRHRHLAVAVLVEHDVAPPGVREGPRRDGVIAFTPELELDLSARDDSDLSNVFARDIECDVAKSVNVENGAGDAVDADFRLGNVEPDERIGTDRRA